MTTLRATSILLGLNTHMSTRERIDTSPNATLVAMNLVLVIATLLATLTKENGALLPDLEHRIYVPVIGPIFALC